MVKPQGVWLKTTNLAEAKEAQFVKRPPVIPGNQTFATKQSKGKKPILMGALALCCCVLLLLVGLHVYPSLAAESTAVADTAPEPVVTAPEVNPEPFAFVVAEMASEDAAEKEPEDAAQISPEDAAAEEDSPQEDTTQEDSPQEDTPQDDANAALPAAAPRTATDNMTLSSRGGEVAPVAEAGSQPDTITVNGEEMSFSRKLTVESTAYTWTGNTTATGTWPEKGTVAVDPGIIPLGTRLYVEGYGFATAEDTGGAIKGNIIDVYFSSYDECIQWGRKRGLTVYILE